MSREGIIGSLEQQGLAVSCLIYSQTHVSVYQGTFSSNYPCAIKVLECTPNTLPSLEHEYLVMTSLKHENILTLFHYFWLPQENPKHLVIASEWCTKDLGKDTKQRKDNKYPWVEADLWQVIFKTVMALAYMQRQGFAHRDIKPENLFYMGDKDKTVKIGDLGSAEKVDNKEVELELVGTPMFMSPKLRMALVMGQRKVIHNAYKSDVYSLGLTFLSMCLLDPPASLVVPNLNDQLAEKVIDSAPYSNNLKSLFKEMLKVEERERCDFEQLEIWLNPAKIGMPPQIDTRQGNYSYSQQGEELNGEGVIWPSSTVPVVQAEEEVGYRPESQPPPLIPTSGESLIPSAPDQYQISVGDSGSGPQWVTAEVGQRAEEILSNEGTGEDWQVAWKRAEADPLPVSDPLPIYVPPPASDPLPIYDPPPVSDPLPVSDPPPASDPLPVSDPPPASDPLPTSDPFPISDSLPVTEALCIPYPPPITESPSMIDCPVTDPAVTVPCPTSDLTDQITEMGESKDSCEPHDSENPAPIAQDYVLPSDSHSETNPFPAPNTQPHERQSQIINEEQPEKERDATNGLGQFESWGRQRDENPEPVLLVGPEEKVLQGYEENIDQPQTDPQQLEYEPSRQDIPPAPNRAPESPSYPFDSAAGVTSEFTSDLQQDELPEAYNFFQSRDQAFYAPDASVPNPDAFDPFPARLPEPPQPPDSRPSPSLFETQEWEQQLSEPKSSQSYIGQPVSTSPTTRLKASENGYQVRSESDSPWEEAKERVDEYPQQYRMNRECPNRFSTQAEDEKRAINSQRQPHGKNYHKASIKVHDDILGQQETFDHKEAEKLTVNCCYCQESVEIGSKGNVQACCQRPDHLFCSLQCYQDFINRRTDFQNGCPLCLSGVSSRGGTPKESDNEIFLRSGKRFEFHSQYEFQGEYPNPPMMKKRWICKCIGKLLCCGKKARKTES